MSHTTPAKPLAIYTIGHSNRPLGMFVDLLRHSAIEHIVDVRTIPRSRHNPQYSIDTLPDSLRSEEIAYTHVPGLGGLRRPLPDSSNRGWRNESFRGYADYMQTAAFEINLAGVISLATMQRCALMCAEAVPWRCHRSLIADALLVRGIGVEDIVGPKERKAHMLTAFAQVDGTRISYPASSEDEPQRTLFDGGG
jgi:uncharacterized protein (DUF488 family)